VVKKALSKGRKLKVSSEQHKGIGQETQEENKTKNILAEEPANTKVLKQE
jgi:hypothetical protein